MRRSERRPRRKGLSTLGYLGLIVGLAAATYATAQSGPASTPTQTPTQTPGQNPGQNPGATPPAKPKPPKPFSPTERINVEQAVDFPYDI